MNEHTLGVTLHQLMKIHGDLSVSELARQTQVPQPTLHHILSGTTKKPRKQALDSLARFFSISVAQLTGSLPLPPLIPNAIKDSLKISTVPLIEWNKLDEWVESKDKQHAKVLKEIIIDNKIGENSFALLMKDSSMEPLFLKNAILVFDSEKKPKDRDFVLAYLAQENLFIFNRLFIDGHDLFLRQDQADGETHLLKLKPLIDKIIATLSEVRTQF